MVNKVDTAIIMDMVTMEDMVTRADTMGAIRVMDMATDMATETAMDMDTDTIISYTYII